MGHAHGRMWTERDILNEIAYVMDALKIDYFPSKSEMNFVTGSMGLSNQVSKKGGSRYFAEMLGLELKSSESELGYQFEEYAIKDIFRNTGFLSRHMKPRYPYDLLTNENIKVDVKVSTQFFATKKSMPAHSFNLEKKYPTCDIFILYCLDELFDITKTIIIPSCFATGKTKIGVGGLSQWDVYRDKWEYFNSYDLFYSSLSKTKNDIPRRRSPKIAEGR